MNTFQTLIGLPNVAGPLEAVMVGSPRAAIRSLGRHCRAATAAGDNGAINVWVNDDGLFEGAFMHYLSTKDWIICTTKADLERWLRKVWDRMGR